MENQNDQIIKENSQIQENNNQDVDPQTFSNNDLNILYEKPIFNLNQNDILAQQDQNDQYFIMPEQPLSSFIKNNKLIIPFKKRIANFIFFLFVFSLSITSTILVPSYHKIYYGIVLTLNTILLLYVENNQIEIIKNEKTNKVYVMDKNFLFITKKKYEFDKDNVCFKIGTYGNNNVLLILNNHKKENEINFSTSNIMYSPLKFLFYINNIDVKKFNGLNQLNRILNEFMDIHNSENPLYFDINSYMNISKEDYNEYSYNKYIRINNRFFTYYSKNFIKNSFRRFLYKVLLSIALIPIFIVVLVQYCTPDRNEKETILLIFIEFEGDLISLYIIIYLICLCAKHKKFQRIDIIYSNDFDKIFVATTKDQTSFFSSSLFSLNEIDRFVLTKNSIKEKGFHLIALLKENPLNREICYVEDSKTDLEGLIFLLNERINNNIKKL